MLDSGRWAVLLLGLALVGALAAAHVSRQATLRDARAELARIRGTCDELDHAMADLAWAYVHAGPADAAPTQRLAGVLQGIEQDAGAADRRTIGDVRDAADRLHATLDEFAAAGVPDTAAMEAMRSAADALGEALRTLAAAQRTRIEHRISGFDFLVSGGLALAVLVLSLLVVRLVRLHAEQHADRDALADSEAQLGALFEQDAFGVACFDAGDGTLIRSNHFFGTSLGAAAGAGDLASLLHGRVDEQPAALLASLAADCRQRRVVEFELTGDDGSSNWFELVLSTVPAAPGLLVVAVLQSIDERKRSEQALNESLARYRALMRTAPDGILVVDRQGVVFANPAAASLFGVADERELLGLSASALTPPTHHRRLRECVREMLAGRAVPPSEEVIRRLDGRSVPVEVACGTFRERGRMLVYVVLRDLSARHDAQAALTASNRRLELALDAARLGVLDWDACADRVSADRATATIFGAALEGLNFDEVTLMIAPDERMVVVERFRAAMQHHAYYEDEFDVIRPDGARCCVHVFARGEYAEDGTFLRTHGILQDVSARREAERAVEESRAVLQSFFDAVDFYMGVVEVLDDDIRFLHLNVPAARRLFDREPGQCRGRLASELGTPPAVLAAIVEAHREACTRGVAVKISYKRPSGQGERTIELTASPLDPAPGSGVMRGCFVKFDVTEQRALEARMQQTQKMEAIGRLAAGVAHDFNNMLSVILGYASLLQIQLEADAPVQRYVTDIRAAGERAAAVTRQLLAFSRRQVLNPEVLDLKEILRVTDRLLRRLLGEQIELVTRFAPALPEVLADPVQIEQVVINLAVNARDAMPRGGRLIIETYPMTLEAADCARHPGRVPGDYAVLAVSDEGDGMSAETLAHVFEPFFTTRPFGQGTGLGLATAFGIVKQSHGHIDVESEPGKGSTFRILLPAHRVVTGTRAEAPAARPRSGAEVLRGARVLLVEDDPRVRQVTRAQLEASGCEVVEAASGAQALECVAQARPDLLLTDVVMPGMSGRDLAGEVTRTMPGVPVLFMSGYTDDEVLRHGVEQARVSFLHKPFELDELVAAVTTAMSAVTPAASVSAALGASDATTDSRT